MLKVYQSVFNNEHDTKLKYIKNNLPKPPFRIILVGSTGSGKSNLIKNICFNREFGYTRYFDEFYIFSGSLDDVYEYKALATNKHKYAVYQNIDFDQLEKLITEMEKSQLISVHKKRNILFVFDDKAFDNISNRNKTNIIDTLFARGRHMRISILISSQKYMQLNQNMRALNLSQLFIFKGTNTIDLDNIAKEHTGEIDIADFRKAITDNLNEQYSFIVIDNKGKDKLLDKNFKPILIKQEMPTDEESSVMEKKTKKT